MGDIYCPAPLTQLSASERPLRQRNFLLLESRNRDYGLNEPIWMMGMRFTDNFFFQKDAHHNGHLVI